VSIRGNCEAVFENIERAAHSSGRSAGDITLIAVTKFVNIQRIAEAIAAGIKAIGENRAQELMEKLDFFESQCVDIHFIGQLQTNKVKYVTGKTKLIQSVDRLALAEQINSLSIRAGVVTDVLAEVNIGGERQKGGIDENELPWLFEMVSAMPGIRVKGLMCVPPEVGEGEARVYFSRMKKLFDFYAGQKYDNVEMKHLSMGMSGDYKAAIAEGATMVRIGSAIFGERSAPV